MLDRISLRQREGGFVVGGSQAGKSTLMEILGRDFVARYAHRGGRRLILDSKPRYRAEMTEQGVSAARRYRKWDHGKAVPGSIVVDDPRKIKLAFDHTDTVIMQCEDRTGIDRLLLGAREFLDASRRGRPQLLQVDETLDFFHSNGAPRGGVDVIERSARGGRERGTSGLYGSQRTKGIPTALLSELTRLYCMRLDFKADAKRLPEMGAPESIMAHIPTDEHLFMYWWKGDYTHLWGPYRLAI